MRKYLIKHKDLNKLLDKFNEFETTYKMFVEKHHNYNYTSTINLVDDIWECEITIKDESKNFRTLEGITAENAVS